MIFCFVYILCFALIYQIYIILTSIGCNSVVCLSSTHLTDLCDYFLLGGSSTADIHPITVVLMQINILLYFSCMHVLNTVCFWLLGANNIIIIIIIITIIIIYMLKIIQSIHYHFIALSLLNRVLSNVVQISSKLVFNVDYMLFRSNCDTAKPVQNSLPPSLNSIRAQLDNSSSVFIHAAHIVENVLRRYKTVLHFCNGNFKY
jgi:hypothetical protein